MTIANVSVTGVREAERVRALPKICSLWVGDRIGYLEQLCLKSARSVGHEVTLYSYEPESLSGLPDSIELRDAREVMPESELVAYGGNGSYALGANFFRYALLAEGLGIWSDMDVLFVKPLDLEGEYVFGWQDDTLINSAVLCAPSRSAFARELAEVRNMTGRPPWYGPKRTVQYYWSRLRDGKISVEDMPWGTFGPEMVTYLAQKHGVASRAQRPDVFYPLHWRDARKLYGPAELVERLIQPETRAIHMWNGALYGLRDLPPPKGSFIANQCVRHDIATN
jgi:hypothetical protein